MILLRALKIFFSLYPEFTTLQKAPSTNFASFIPLPKFSKFLIFSLFLLSLTMNIYLTTLNHSHPNSSPSLFLNNNLFVSFYSNLLQMDVFNTATIISDHGNKENVPPFCNSNVNKDKGKASIPHIMSISFKNKKRSTRKLKRLPLADITNLFNNSATDVFDLSDPQMGFSVIPRRIPCCSKTLRMRFR